MSRLGLGVGARGRIRRYNRQGSKLFYVKLHVGGCYFMREICPSMETPGVKKCGLTSAKIPATAHRHYLPLKDVQGTSIADYFLSTV